MKCTILMLMLLPSISFAQTSTPAIIDIDKAAYKAIKVPEEPDFLAADEDFAWVIDNNNNRIQKISVNSTGVQLIDTIPGACAAPVIAFNAVWVLSCSEKKLYKIDKNNGRVLSKMATGIADANGEMSLAAGNGSIWLLSSDDGVLTRINPIANTVQITVKVKPHSYCAGFGHGSIWVTNTAANSVQRISVKTNEVSFTIPVGKKPRFIAVGEQAVWVLNQGDGTVTRIDETTNKAVATINVKAPGGGGDITEGGGKVWIVSTNIERPLQTINIANNTVDNIYLKPAGQGKHIKVDGAARASAKYIWVSNMYSKTVWAFKK